MEMKLRGVFQQSRYGDQLRVCYSSQDMEMNAIKDMEMNLGVAVVACHSLTLLNWYYIKFLVATVCPEVDP